MFVIQYQGSKDRFAKYIVPIIQNYIDGNDIHTYIDLFCLSGNTVVFTKNGIKELKDISIGEYIIDDCGKYTKVINKIKTDKKIGKHIKVKGNADIIATDNHKFYVENEEICVYDLKIGMSLDIGVSNNISNEPIDLSNYLTISNLPHGKSGRTIGDNKVKLYHFAPVTNRFIPITKELMRCYGLVVSEGCKSNITMHESEVQYLEEFNNNYCNILGINENNKKYTFNKENHSCQYSVPLKAIYEKLFFKAMGVGYGARNKNISFLFSLDNDLVLEAIRYMYIGDGSCSNDGKYRKLNYKTSSKTLAYQLQAILSIKLGIKSTISYGLNKERFIGERKLLESDYYNISITRDSDIEFILGLSNDKISIHEKTNKYVITDIYEEHDDFYDITIDNNSHRFIIGGGIVTHNCGGANIIDKVRCDNKYAYDKHHYLIELLKHVQLTTEDLPDRILEDEYKLVRDNKEKYPDWYVGLVGFGASYGSKWFNGYARNSSLDTNGERTSQSIRNLIKQSPNLSDIVFECSDFRDVNPFKIEGSLIYCDIPYKNTTKYKTGDFPYDEFYEYCKILSKKNIVLISEYNMPEEFECIWQMETKSLLDSGKKSNDEKNNRIEKLFVCR